MITKIRKLATNNALRPVFVVAAILVTIEILLWPIEFFQGDARWVGEAFWIGVLILAAVTAFLVIDWILRQGQRRKQKREKVPNVTAVEVEADSSAFEAKVRASLKDRSIVGYFARNLVKEDDVTEALVNGVAFAQALEVTSHESFTNVRAKEEDIIGENNAITSAIILDDAGPRIAIAFTGTFLLVALLFTEVNVSNLVTSGIVFTSTIFAGASAWLFARTQSGAKHRFRDLALSVLAICVSVWVVILQPIITNIQLTPFLILFPVWIIALAVCYALSTGQSIEQCVSLLVFLWNKCYLLFLRDYMLECQTKWLNDCDNIINEQANLTINTVLGKDKDRLLVEQDSEGLRKLQDPSYTVPTRSEHRIASVLYQVGAASIALAGPRGAGKSTLLRKFSAQRRSKVNDAPCIYLYLTAPAEYIPRDFIATFFQQLCEEYLVHEGRPLPPPIYKEASRFSFRHALGRFFRFLWLFIDTVLLIAVVVWITRSLVSTHYHHMYITTSTTFRHWYNQAHNYVINSIYKPLRPYWTAIRILLLIILVPSLLSIPGRWKKNIKPPAEPTLVKSAQEYLRRLQVEKTVTWGTSVGSPTVRGASLSLNRGGTASYVPWTLPELVGHTRRFMQDIAKQFSDSDHAVIVGIDEIDRIDSLDHAERFVGEIKAIFGVEKCFFLVTVAEDVGSIFAQRATAGRSILENAFDDIVVVEPLNFQETRDLLLKRVPGFTDSFVYLVLALSGGLPRELIRITRRLVDINHEASTSTLHPRLQDLAFCLVRDELIEAMRATRNQMSRLTLHTDWTLFFEKLQSASSNLRRASPFSVNESYGFIEGLSDLTVPDVPEEARIRRALVTRDEDEAKRIVRDFTAFSYFGMTVIEAFSDRLFDLQVVQQATARGSKGSYEELAVARAELAVSPENSRAMLRRFREALSSRKTI